MSRNAIELKLGRYNSRRRIAAAIAHEPRSSAVTSSSPCQIIARGRALIEHERHWTQGARARRDDGERTDPHDARADRFCATGALMRAAFEITQDAIDPILLIDMLCAELRPRDLEPVRAVESINDVEGHAAILALFDGYVAKPSPTAPTLAQWRASSRFRIGQRVVCIDAGFSTRPEWRRAVQRLPKVNATYTIRGLCRDGDLVGLWFVELTNKPAMFGGGLAEPAFNSRKFRPLAKTNIDIFKKLLMPADLVEVE